MESSIICTLCQYYQDDQPRKGEMGRACSVHGEEEKCVQKSGGKRPLARPRHRWEYNIKIDLLEIGLEGVDWIHLAQDRDHGRQLVNMIINLQIL
jgi:hypothetical protein